MRWTRTLLPTLREPPAEVRGAGLQLLHRAGLVRGTESDSLAFLPLGFRSLRKLAKLARDTVRDAGFVEVLVGAGDLNAIVTDIAAQTVSSYKQLPVRFLQIAPDASSLPMLQAHSFHSTEPDLLRTTSRVRAAFGQIFSRCGIRNAEVEARNGSRFVALSSDGDDEVVLDDRGTYAATVDAARTGERPWAFAGEPAAPLEKVQTPNLASVDEVCAFLKFTPRQILKTLVFQATSPIPVNWVVAVVRGDHQVNQWKLAQAAAALGVTSLRLVDSPEVRQRFPIGFVGPDTGTKTPDAVLVVDPDAAQGDVSWAAGANEVDFHVRNFNWFRDAGDRLADPAKVLVADIRNAIDGDPSPTPAGGTLRRHRAIALGEISNLGTGLSEARRALFDDESGTRRPLTLGAYRVNLLNVLLATVEAAHDEHGIRWPAPIAPCSVVLTPIKYDGDVRQAADKLYTQLTFEGVDTILDDRDARAGFKFADADLVGFPIRLNVGQKHLAEGRVEMKRRATLAEVEFVPLDQVVARVRAALTES
ncbi:MAG TPA: His/Gly/Thr/Pro-type tRNA ligase C-terminal domain-containing protein [Tepidisphaeraceae bacterium]|jgi:prolyl-tRNA synthetase